MLMAAAGVVHAAAQQHVKASILADVKTVTPGESFDVGVLFRIDPDWHIYWENQASPARQRSQQSPLQRCKNRRGAISLAQGVHLAR